jgi:hypothetical protein
MNDSINAINSRQLISSLRGLFEASEEEFTPPTTAIEGDIRNCMLNMQIEEIIALCFAPVINCTQLSKLGATDQ